MSTRWVPIGPSCIPNAPLAIRSYAWYHPGLGHGSATGRVSAIALSPDGATIYAGAASGGVWKSTDEGASWTPILDGQASQAIGAIAVASDGTIYVGTGEAHSDSTSAGVMTGVGILWSSDGGATWNLFPPQIHADNLVGARVARIVVHPTDPAHFYAATDRGLLVTTDRATPHLLHVNQTFSDVVVDFADPAVPRIYAGMAEDGIYVADGPPTADAQLTRLAKSPAARGRIALALSRSSGPPQTVYAVLAEGDNLQRIVLSTNRGADWTDLEQWQFLKSAQQLSYNLFFEVDPRDPDKLFFGETRLYRRTKRQFWNVVSRRGGFLGQGSYQGVHDDQHALVFHPTQADTIWLANDGGVWRSTDGGEHFHARNRGLGVLQLYSFAQHPTESELGYAGTQDNGAVRYVGHPAWREVRGGDVFGTAIHPAMPNVWLAAPLYSQGRTMRSLRHGVEDSFEDRKKGLPELEGISFVAVAPHPHEPTTWFAGAFLLYWSHGANGHGTKWDAIDASDDGEEGFISAIAIAPSAAHVVYYARVTWTPMGPAAGSIHRVELAAGGWQHVAVSTTPLADDCQQILVDANDPDRFIAVLGSTQGHGFTDIETDRVLRGEVHGDAIALAPLPALHPGGFRTIETVDIKTKLIQCNAIVRDPVTPATLYLGTDYGVYRSLDDTATWTVFGTGLPEAAVVTAIQLHPTSRRLRVSTMGRGVWECALDELDRDVDLYVRDCLHDHGRGVTPATRGNPGGLGELRWTDAPDLKLDTESIVFGDFEMPASVAYDGAALDYVGFELLDGDAPRARSTSRVYVQIHNRGPQAIADVLVRVFLATKGSGGFPALPADFWATWAAGAFADGAWRALGPVQTLHQLAAAAPQVARFDHTFHGAGDTIGLLAVVSSPQDPVPVLALDVEQAVRADKHVMLKQLEVKTSVLTIVIETLVIVGLLGAATYAVTR